MTPHTRWSHFRTSFQFKLFFIFSLLTFLIATLLSAVYIIAEARDARLHVTEKLQLQAKYLANSVRLPLYAENRAVLMYLAGEIALEPEIRTVIISNPGGRVLADVLAPGSSRSAEVISQTAPVYSSHLVDSVESSLAGSRDDTVVLIGTVRLERGTADLSEYLRRITMISIASAIAFWMIVVFLCYVVLRRVTGTFNSLVHGINVMKDGDLNFRIDVTTTDEPGRAAQAVNSLASALQQRDAENSRLQDERLNIERQMLHAQRLESLGVMAGGIAHDFNNLLQAMLGNMELALMKLTTDLSAKKYVASAVGSAKRAALLTNLMLTYLGKGLITKKDLNLNALIRANADMLRTAATSAVTVELHLSDELPVVHADEASIQQIVMNLITNAAESIESAQGLVRINTGVQFCAQACLEASLLNEKPEPGRFAVFEVCDNGCGMSETTLKRIFDPFFTTKFTGRGLGMSAVVGIIRTHKGALFVESEPGRGTTFRVLLPVSESAPLASALEITAPVRDAGAPPEESLSGLALVVDDEKSVLRVCTKMVSLCGFTVITACDGIDAVARFRERAAEISLVLLDLTMPNMDGITAMGEILSIKPDVKVILASGFNEEELGDRIVNNPPSGFIRKPYSMNALEEEIKRVMRSE